MEHWEKTVNKVLDRMKAAHNANKGIRLSADELECLSISFIGEIWEDSLSSDASTTGASHARD